MINLYGISGILTGVTSLAIAIFVYTKGRRNKLNKLWALFAASVSIYGFGAYMVSIATSPAEGFFWWQVTLIGVILIPPLFIHFVYVFLNIKRPYIIKSAYLLTIIFLALDIFSKKLFIGNIKLLFTDSKWGPPIYWVRPPGFFYAFFIIFVFLGWIAYSHFALINAYKKTVGLKRNQIRYFFLATAIGFIGGGACFFPCFGLDTYPIYNFTIPLYPVIMTYAIIRHHLMDIKFILKKTVVFASLFAIVFGIFIGITLLTQELIAGGRLIGFVASTIIIIFSVRPLEDFLIKITNKYLFQKKYDPRQIIRSFIDYATTVLDLDKIVKETTELLEKAFHPKFSDILLLNGDNDKYISHGITDETRINVLKDDSSIIEYLKSIKDILSIENDNDKKITEEVRREMNNLKATLTVPLILRDELIGIMLLGKKKSDEYYTQEDLITLMDLARTEAIAIKNAQLTKAIAEKSEEKGIEDASLGASHQMKNTLAVIKPPLETIYALISSSDLNTITPEKSKSLLVSSKERITKVLQEIEKGRNIINAILYGDQKEDDAPKEINIQSFVQHSIERSSQAKSQELVARNIPIPALVNSVPKDFPTIIASGILIGEALVNIINNSFDAIIERYVHLKPDSSYKSMIKISAEDMDKYIKISIEDNGMGMTEETKNKAFKGLYTTKKASARGRGAALFFLKKWLKARGGSVNFMSEYGKGTTFTIELPKKQEDSNESKDNDSR